MTAGEFEATGVPIRFIEPGSRGWKERRGTLRATSEGLELDGKLRWPHFTLKAGTWLPEREGRVRFLTGAGAPVDVSIDETRARELLSALGFTAPNRPQVFLTLSVATQKPGYATQFNLIVNGVMVIGVGGAWLLVKWLFPTFPQWILLIAAAIVALFVTLRLHAWTTASVIVNEAGLTIADGKDTRRLAWRDVSEIEPTATGVHVTSIAGETTFIPTKPQGAEDMQRDVLVQVLREYRAAALGEDYAATREKT